MANRRPSIAWVEEWMSWRAFNVLPRLAERFDITYVTTGEEIPPAPFKNVIRLPRWKHMMLAGFSISRCVDRLYRRGAIDLALVYASIGFGIRRTPYIALEGGSTYRELQLFYPQRPWYRRGRLLTGFIHYALPEIVCVRRAMRVIAISESLRRDLVTLHGLPAERVGVIYNGIGREYLDVFSRRRPAAERPRLLYVGRLHYRKGILRVLEEVVRRPDLNVEFVVAGDGPDRPAVERLAGVDRRIRYAGHVGRAQLLELLATSAVFVFPSHFEGFGSALVEAMAAGLPCVAYDIPVAREILDGAGLLVPVGDAPMLVEQLAGLLTQPSRTREYSLMGHRRAQRYSWETCADQLTCALRRALLDRPGR
jgi:glycosyltransferase involved in cell wall biosynthesis